MGYFANLYLVEVSTAGDLANVSTMIYGRGIGARAYFSWGPGDRPEGLHPYGHGTLFCDIQLTLLKGYPLIERYPASEPFLLDASFTPRENSDPVVFHIILNESYVPMRNRNPFIQPSQPCAYRQQERIIITYPVVGSAGIRFWISRIKDNESLDDYDLTKIVQPEVRDPGKFKFKFNLGVFGVEREMTG